LAFAVIVAVLIFDHEQRHRISGRRTSAETAGMGASTTVDAAGSAGPGVAVRPTPAGNGTAEQVLPAASSRMTVEPAAAGGFGPILD
jgi:hypothetical protein